MWKAHLLGEELISCTRPAEHELWRRWREREREKGVEECGGNGFLRSNGTNTNGGVVIDVLTSLVLADRGKECKIHWFQWGEQTCCLAFVSVSSELDWFRNCVYFKMQSMPLGYWKGIYFCCVLLSEEWFPSKCQWSLVSPPSELRRVSEMTEARWTALFACLLHGRGRYEVRQRHSNWICKSPISCLVPKSWQDDKRCCV